MIWNFLRLSQFEDFISRLLVVDCDYRMSASEALLHPWLQLSKNKSNPRRISMVQTGPKLTNVMARLKWQKCANAITACSALEQHKTGASNQ